MTSDREPTADYDAFARRLAATDILTDPWFEGQPRFRQEPVWVEAKALRAMYRAAERVAEVYNELCLIVAENPGLLDEFFALTPYQKAMWFASQPLWHGIARADVFVTDEGLSIAELNCDTPTGEAEAVVVNAVVAPDHPAASDPNAELEARFCALVDTMSDLLVEGDRPRTVGLLYPTEFPEDLALVRLYRHWLERRGYTLVLGSPYNLTYDEGGPLLFDRPIGVLLRHYKTDWWGERVSAWTDEPIPDAAPLAQPLEIMLRASLEKKCAIINPFGALLPQNKRSMAFMWEHIHRFSPGSQEVIQAHVPITSRLEVLHKEQLLAQQEEWVLKSAFGAEGEEVVIGRRVTSAQWQDSLAHARVGSWIAQRYFTAEQSAAGESINYGVFLVAGEAAGLYARIQAGPTDERAISAPALVRG